MGLSKKRKEKLQRALRELEEKGAGSNDKPYGGNGAATYAEDFTSEERSAVMDGPIALHKEEENEQD